MQTQSLGLPETTNLLLAPLKGLEELLRPREELPTTGNVQSSRVLWPWTHEEVVTTLNNTTARCMSYINLVLEDKQILVVKNSNQILADNRQT